MHTYTNVKVALSSCASLLFIRKWQIMFWSLNYKNYIPWHCKELTYFISVKFLKDVNSQVANNETDNTNFTSTVRTSIEKHCVVIHCWVCWTSANVVIHCWVCWHQQMLSSTAEYADISKCCHPLLSMLTSANVVIHCWACWHQQMLSSTAEYADISKCCHPLLSMLTSVNV